MVRMLLCAGCTAAKMWLLHVAWMRLHVVLKIMIINKSIFSAPTRRKMYAHYNCTQLKKLKTIKIIKLLLAI